MKTNLDSLFKSNSSLETEGVIFEINDTTSFHVRRFGGKNATRVKAAMAKYYKPYARQVELGQLSPDKEHEILVNAFVDACMIDWKGVEIDGKESDYSPEAAKELFNGLPELFAALHEYASSFDSFKEDLGNS